MTALFTMPTYSPFCDVNSTPLVFQVSRSMEQERLISDPTGKVLSRPLWVHAKYTEDNYWLVTTPGTMAYGAGDTLEDAYFDLISMLLDLYHELSTSDDLSKPLQIELAYLNSVLAK